MPKYENERTEGRPPRPKKKGPRGGTGSLLGSVVASAAATEGLFEIIDRLGLIDLVVEKVKQRVEEVELDELLEDVRDYLKKNPEVLVVSLGALTVASGIIVYLNARREWDGEERRRLAEEEAVAAAPAPARPKGSRRGT